MVTSITERLAYWLEDIIAHAIVGANAEINARKETPIPDNMEKCGCCNGTYANCVVCNGDGYLPVRTD